jgi:apoptosis-inducing factor 2
MKVLVIGGGMGGVAACTGIRSYVPSSTEIVLVEPKDHIEIVWAAYRSLFDKEMAESSIFPLDTWATKHNVLHIMSTVIQLQLVQEVQGQQGVGGSTTDDHDATSSTITSTSNNQATLANGTVIDFDVCVLAMGAANPYAAWGRGPDHITISRSERLITLQKHGEALLNANTVLIVGGGLVGTELAGDLAVFSRDAGNSTRVILVHSGPRLCHDQLDETAATMLYDKLVELGVKPILNDTAIPIPTTTTETAAGSGTTTTRGMTLASTGQVLQADLVVMANGLTPVNNSFIDSKYLNDKGYVQVDEYFQVIGAPQQGTLFAIGDCCTALPNTGHVIINNINVIGYNVKEALNAKASGKAPWWLSKQHPHSGVYICTVGPEDGVACSPYCYSSDWVLPGIKNCSMFLYDVRNKFGLEQENPK